MAAPEVLSVAEVLDAVAVCTWRWEIASQRVEWSPGLEALMGLPPGTFGGTFDAYLACLPVEDRAAVVAAVRASLDGAEPYEIEHRVNLPGDEVRWVLCRGRALRGPGGEAIGMSGVVWDITRRRAVELHAARVQRLSSVVTAINKEIVRVSSEQELFDRACRIAVEQGGLRLAWVGLVEPDGTVRAVARWGHDDGYVDALRVRLGSPEWGVGPTAGALSSGAPVVCGDINTDPRMGTVRALAAARGLRSSGAFPFRKAGRLVGVLNIYAGTPRWFDEEEVALLVGLADDIAYALDALAREEERRATADQLRFHAAVLAQVNEAVIATDPAGKITYWNDASERLYGYSAAEALGRDATTLLGVTWPNPADRVTHVTALRSVGSWRGEMVHTKKSGAPFVVEASIGLLRDANGRAIAGINVIQDVTSKRKLEEQLRHAQKMEAIGVLAGGVAHDFNNLLGIIMGFSELALKGMPPEHKDARSLREVVAAAHRGAQLTRKLLAFSRKQILRPAPLDLGAAVAEGAKLLTRIMGEDVQVLVSRPEAALVVRADPVQIEQVLLNLCTNARQAMPHGGKIEIDVAEVTVDLDFVRRNQWAKIGRFAQLTVSDTGVGMDRATLARIFEPFFTTKERGTGLGLATVYGIVEQHGGAVHAESTPGTGTKFRLHLPLVQELALVPRAPPPEPATPGGTETILVAEDAAPLRAFVAETLASLGYRVIEAQDGDEAVREYERRAGDISLVVLDVVMPRLGGLAAYERMRAIRPDVRTLFTTGYAPEAIQLTDLVATEGLRVLEKPFSSRELGLAVRAAIDG